MKYLITEDTTDGYEFWCLVNKYLLNNEFKVINVGQYTTNNKGGGNSAILKFVTDFVIVDEISNYYYIIIDKVIDNDSAMKIYRSIETKVKGHCNIKLIGIVCFEHCLLEFEKIIEWTMCNTWYKNVREQLLYCINNNIGMNGVAQEYYRNNLPELIRAIGNRNNVTVEKMCKATLKNIIVNTGFDNIKGILNNNMMNFLGDCWKRDCCIEHISDFTEEMKINGCSEKVIETAQSKVKRQNKWISHCKIKRLSTKDKFKTIYEYSEQFKKVIDKLKSK